MRSALLALVAFLLASFVFSLPAAALSAAPTSTFQEFAVPSGSHPHDVAPAADGGVWFTAQMAGYLGWLNPATGEIRQTPLGPGSAPHGVIVGPDGAPWVTDGGLNAIVRVDPVSGEVHAFPLPTSQRVDLNTATFDSSGVLWFTGQSGVYGRLDPTQGEVQVFAAPRGPGAYGMTTTPSGDVFFASLASNYIARIDLETRAATPIDPPSPSQGARRIWSDSRGWLWVSEWNAGQLARYDPASGEWQEFRLPGTRPTPYAVYVDDQNRVWLSDWSSNAIISFDPETQTFRSYPFTAGFAGVRQLLGRHGELWAAESAADKLAVLHTTD